MQHLYRQLGSYSNLYRCLNQQRWKFCGSFEQQVSSITFCENILWCMRNTLMPFYKESLGVYAGQRANSEGQATKEACTEERAEELAEYLWEF